PDTEIVGVDLDVRSQEIAEAKARFHGLDNIRFLTSPRSDALPDIGNVDHVSLTAVYEHLLPNERRSVLPMLWEALKPGGTMFIYGTPYRWWPVEVHTTRGLPLLNYLPDGLAHVYTRYCARDNIRKDDWPTLLRKGIRGGSISEVKRMLRGRQFRMLEPTAIDGRDGVDLWWHYTPKRWANRVFYRFMKLVRYLTGLQTVKTLEIALRKE